MGDASDWWRELMEERYCDGCHDAEKEIFNPPYPGNNDPQDEDENQSYKNVYMKRRKQLNDES